jgi:hypothetical protein
MSMSRNVLLDLVTADDVHASGTSCASAKARLWAARCPFFHHPQGINLNVGEHYFVTLFHKHPEHMP